MIELAFAAAVCAVLLALLWWYDSNGPREWDDLLSPAALQAYAFLQKKFQAEQRAVGWTYARTVAAPAGDFMRLADAGAAFLAGVVPDRLMLLRRLALYSRMAAAIAPPPNRLQVRLRSMSRSFAALAKPRPAADPQAWDRIRDVLKTLDDETLESFRIILASIAGPTQGMSQ